MLKCFIDLDSKSQYVSIRIERNVLQGLRGRPSWLLPHALHGCALRRMEFVFASLPEMLSASQAAFVQTLENVCQHSGGR